MAGQPTKIGKYDILRLIGRGGMGVVYEALDPKLERHVAIKMILGATPGLLARFDREARSTGSLQHQNIVTIYEFGDQDGSPYLVMEYLEGMSLDAALSSGRKLSLATRLSICVDVCNGLNYAHDRGIIHRDIKPGNIMLLEDGNVKIVDFGIARIGDTGASHTEVVGSLHYMSPEQFQSQPLDRRTDIFSTGVVLYQMLTGALPFQASGGEAAVMYRIINEDPAPLSSYLQDYPAELDDILRKALAKNRDLRYASARDLSFDLLAVMERAKHEEVAGWMKRADAAMQRTEWSKAEDCLRQVLKVDKNHTPAHQLLSHVQVRIREQKKVDQVRQLRMQADGAFLERRYDEALRTIDQAIAIDDTNKDLISLRSAIQEAKSRATRFKLALRRAEEAHRAGDLEEAKQAVREALEIDPTEPSATALQVVILKQVEEQDRQVRLRTLFDNARDQISARNLTAAFETLKEAEQVDPASVELYSLMKVVSAAREEQFRKQEMEKLTREIGDALNREDYAAAIAVANEGLQKHPREQGLLRLKALAEAQHQRAQLKAFARDQFLAANGLLEAGQTGEALSTIENALRTIPGDPQLERLRAIVKDRLAEEEAESRKRQLLAQAQEMTAAERFDDALRVLESVRREFSGAEEVDLLLERVRAKATQANAIAQALERAQQLLSQGSAEQAVQFLEYKTLDLSDARLFDLLDRARRQRDQFRSGLQNSLEEAKRILESQGATDAARYLAVQPAKYREIAEFRALAEVVAQRVAFEALDQELMSQTDPDSQVRLAEAALRANPGNEEIKKRLATVRTRKEQITAIAEKAHALESSRQFPEAVKQLQVLRQLYPQYPGLESNIRRLERLEEQRVDEDARRQQEQLRAAVQGAIDEGRRILQSRGVAEATKYLAAQPAQYRETAEFKAFAETLARRAAWEALDRDLAGNTDADAQIRLAEAALRESPANEEIKKRLAALRGRKERIGAMAAKARTLEDARQYGDAAQELQQLRALHPQHPNIDSEIARLERLEEQRRADEERRQAELFHAAVRKAVEEGNGILQRQGAVEAAKYLGAQPAKYREVPEFRKLTEVVASRVAIEALEQELLRRPDPGAQVRAAEAAFRENPANEEIKKKLTEARGRRDQIQAVTEKARGLETARQYTEAAKEWQQVGQIYPQYPNLESEIRRLERLEEQRVLEVARREAEQFQSAVRSAVEEGQRILQKRGVAEAGTYLNAQPAKYRETPEFRAFAEVVAKRAAWEALDHDLAANTDADAQIRLAETALRESPGNEEIRKRLAALRSRKEQIKTIAEKVRGLEAARQYGDAAKELQHLRQLYPQYPDIDSEIARLDRLEEQKRAEEARHQRELFQAVVRKAIEEGNAILQRLGALEAAKYLAGQPVKYREVAEFVAFAQVVASRVASQALEQELLRAPDPDAQVRAAEAALQENPANEEIKKRLAEVRQRREQIHAITDKARALEASGQYPGAANELQQLRQIYPQYLNLDSEIRRLERLDAQRMMDVARREAEQFQAGLRSAIEEGQRILQNRGAAEAASYLGAQPAKYRERPEFRALAEMVAKRVALDGLEQSLAANTDPEAQVRAAEAALRENPGIDEIKKRLAAVRSRREQVNAIAEKARTLESSRKYAKAAKELQKMRPIYEGYPNLEAEIRRLEEREEEGKKPRRDVAKTKSAEPVAEPPVHPDSAAPEVGATVIMGRRPVEDARKHSVAAPIADAPHQVETRLEQVDVPVSPKGSPKIWLIAAIALLVLAAAGIIYRVTNHPSHPSDVLVRVSPIPEDSSVVIDGVPCPAPCQRQLPEGKHTVAANHDGYVSANEDIQVKNGSSTDFALNLSPAEVALSNESTGTGQTSTAKPRASEQNPKSRETRPALTAKNAVVDTKPPATSPSLQPKLGSSAPVAAAVVISKLPPGAVVKVEGGDTHQADASGTARFNVPVGDHTLQMTAEGYSSKTIQHKFLAGENTLDGVLEPDPEQQEWARVDSGNDSAALQSFLKRFPAGKHAELAKAKLDKLNSSTSPPANVAKNTSSLTDGGMISDTLGQFEQAYSRKNANDVCAIWPGCPRKAFEKVFHDAISVSMKFQPSGPPQISGESASVVCSRVRVTTYKGTPPLTGNDTVAIHLRKENGKWRIDSIESK